MWRNVAGELTRIANWPRIQREPEVLLTFGCFRSKVRVPNCKPMWGNAWTDHPSHFAVFQLVISSVESLPGSSSQFELSRVEHLLAKLWYGWTHGKQIVPKNIRCNFIFGTYWTTSDEPILTLPINFSHLVGKKILSILVLNWEIERVPKKLHRRTSIVRLRLAGKNY